MRTLILSVVSLLVLISSAHAFLPLSGCLLDLVSEQSVGFNTICYYDCNGSTYANKISSTSSCPVIFYPGFSQGSLTKV